jgi:tripartite-type tricarboxylate transporter receptor subunit TctC
MTSNGFQVAAGALFKRPGFDPVNSFEHICLVWSLPWILVASTRMPVQNYAEFLKYVKANPNKLSAAWYTAASRISLSQLRRAGSLDVLEVPYKASSQVISDMRGGEIDFAFLPPDVALAQAAAGTVKLIAISSPSRRPSAPNLPALSEQLPGLAMVSWVGVAAPAGTPKAVVTKIESAFARVMAKPDVIDKLRQFGADAEFVPSARIPAQILEEIPQFASSAKAAGIDAE